MDAPPVGRLLLPEVFPKQEARHQAARKKKAFRPKQRLKGFRQAAHGSLLKAPIREAGVQRLDPAEASVAEQALGKCPPAKVFRPESVVLEG